MSTIYACIDEARVEVLEVPAEVDLYDIPALIMAQPELDQAFLQTLKRVTAMPETERREFIKANLATLRERRRAEYRFRLASLFRSARRNRRKAGWDRVGNGTG